MKERYFRFKEFGVDHSRSGMKVGVDGVLIGAWADISGARRVLDAGSGCGLVALMAAQRNADALITGLELEGAAVEESRENAARSPWCDRVEIVQGDFLEFAAVSPLRFDHIVSNPPYFHGGATGNATARELARQATGLSPRSLLEAGARLLAPDGRISLVAPSDWLEEMLSAGLHARRITFVRDNPEAAEKRVLCEFSACAGPCEEGHLTLYASKSDRTPTEGHRALCAPFYLAF